MATGTASPNYHGQLTAAPAVDSITLDRNWKWINVVNDDGTSRIDFTVDGSTPVTNGSAAGFVVPAAIGQYKIDLRQARSKLIAAGGNGQVVVKLISAGTPRYSIIGGQ